MTALLAATILLLQLLSQVLAKVACGVELPSGYVEYPWDNYAAIKIYTEELQWNEARRRCISDGADLVVATSLEKTKHIRNRSGNSWLWIGIHRPTGTGDWVRADTGRPITSLPWITFTGSDDNNCASTANPDGTITDRRCEEVYPFACEISLAEGCPGPVGPQGTQGPQGPKGDTGSPGLTGSEGEKGEPGAKGSDGSPGVPGKIGSTGDVGAPGPQGLTGPSGEKGEPGVPGIRGKPGENGVDGFAGPEGLPGPPGDDGRRGPVGSPGPRGPRGPIGPSGLLSPAGDPGTDGEPGPPGPAGPPGERGLRGIDGVQGPMGERGLGGDKGEQGLPGIQGAPGPMGERGLTGLGAPGPMGPPGLPGPRGYSEKDGLRGPPGIGVAGPPGPGYNATWFALLAACQEHDRVGSLIDGGETPTNYGNYSLVEHKCKEFIAKAYEQMWVAFQNPSELEVLEESTAKTCQDLFIAHPDTPSGEYWIDPNGGDASDKMLVYCDAEKRSTCITPSINQSQLITYEGEEEEVWLSEHEMGMQITYTADDHQINALQLLSRHAEQKVIYHCMKSVGYFDAEGHYGRGLKLSAWNGVELKPRGRQSLRYDVISDECQNRTNEWQDTVIAYRTSRPVLLPILDVALRDLGKPDKRAIVEIGDVCFS